MAHFEGDVVIKFKSKLKKTKKVVLTANEKGQLIFQTKQGPKVVQSVTFDESGFKVLSSFYAHDPSAVDGQRKLAGLTAYAGGDSEPVVIKDIECLIFDADGNPIT